MVGLEQKSRSREWDNGSEMGQTGAGAWAREKTVEKYGPDGNITEEFKLGYSVQKGAPSECLAFQRLNYKHFII